MGRPATKTVISVFSVVVVVVVRISSNHPVRYAHIVRSEVAWRRAVRRECTRDGLVWSVGRSDGRTVGWSVVGRSACRASGPVVEWRTARRAHIPINGLRGECGTQNRRRSRAVVSAAASGTHGKGERGRTRATARPRSLARNVLVWWSPRRPPAHRSVPTVDGRHPVAREFAHKTF